jgi:2-hydroxychromene-2-carboxylate isomerase
MDSIEEVKPRLFALRSNGTLKTKKSKKIMRNIRKNALATLNIQNRALLSNMRKIVQDELSELYYAIDSRLEETNRFVNAVLRTCSDNKTQLEDVRQFLEVENRSGIEDEDWDELKKPDHLLTNVLKQAIQSCNKNDNHLTIACLKKSYI